MKSIRIGAGAGYSGDRIPPAVELAEKGDLDYLVFECLAERTIALAQLERSKDARLGFDPLLRDRMEAVLLPCAGRGVKIITNMGAANPQAAGEEVIRIARELGLDHLKVAVVQGDDVLPGIHGQDLTLLESGAPLQSLGSAVLSANAYLGAEALVRALRLGADVVITGRVADPALFVAPLIHEFDWSMSDWQKMGQGTVVGHLLECAGQVTGGYFADPGYRDVPDLARLGFPLAEVSADGSAIITKVAGSGGCVSTATCTAQLLYEIENPARYLQPDVVADFSGVTLTQVGYEEVGFAPLVLTDEGLPSVSEAALKALNDPVVDRIAGVRHQRMLLDHVHDLTSDRLRGEFHIAGSVSGRVYMRKPNLVGLPRELRRFIVAAPGHVLIIADYSQMELRVLAALSWDPGLVRAFIAGEDLHRKMAALIYGIPLDAVTDEQRGGAGKTTNFATIYGQMAPGLAEALGVPLQDAARMLLLHQKTYPRVWKWRREKLDEARAAGGLLRTWLGRKRNLPSICHGSTEAARKLINHQVQSVAADIAKSRLTQIADAVRGRAWPVLFAHDEFVLECLPEHAADVLATAVAIAERDVTGFGVPLKVKAAICKSWAEKP